ncbi:acetyltransferase, partial [human gut metagenome]
GIASQLTVAVLEDLKRQGLKVVPLCRFMARYILRHPEWKQMVADK